MEAGVFIRAIEKRQGSKTGCLEEIALEMDFLRKTNCKTVATLPNSSYKECCLDIAEEYEKLYRAGLRLQPFYSNSF
ncbi:MAG TPA: hypothetical protein VEC36_08255 [Patescibacteria group bacterium]|nr:hypothetical protein [Patescibacteria group bacterium]